MASIVQDWVSKLEWQQQVTLLSVIRDCDITEKDINSSLIKALRGVILYSESAEPSSFIEHRVDDITLTERMLGLLKRIDLYPISYLRHLMQASKIIGLCHPWKHISNHWRWFYVSLDSKLESKCERN